MIGRGQRRGGQLARSLGTARKEGVDRGFVVAQFVESPADRGNGGDHDISERRLERTETLAGKAGKDRLDAFARQSGENPDEIFRLGATLKQRRVVG